jgi:membrane protein DedA with SNARE-associated domain
MPALIAQYGLFLVALIIFAGENGLPTLIPGELALLLAGSQLIHSPAALVGAMVAFGIVDLVATSTIHLAARTGGNRLLCRLLRCFQRDGRRPEELVERWRHRLGGHDTLVVFVTRLIPMFRLYASITTGLIRIRFRDFLIGAIPAALVWAATPLTIGYLLRARMSTVTGQYSHFMPYVIAGSVLLTFLLGAGWWVHRAGSPAAALPRFRFALGLPSVCIAAALLVTVTIHGNSVINHRFSLPPLSGLAIWVCILSVAAMGLIWIAAHDLRSIRTHYRRARGVGALSATTWVSLMVVLCLMTATTGVPYLGL